MIFGTLKPALAGIKDIGWRESLIFAPLVVLTILFGVAPKPVLDMSAASVTHLLDRYDRAVKAAELQEQRAKIELVSAQGRHDADERRPMMRSSAIIHGLLPILPEIVLALGAMVLLMVGAAAGERSAAAVNGAFGHRADRGGRGHRDAAARALCAVRRQLRGRRLRALPQAVGAHRLGRRAGPVARLSQAREAAEVRIRRAVPAVDARHADADLGRRPDRALSRARADEPGALRGGGLSTATTCARPRRA